MAQQKIRDDLEGVVYVHRDGGVDPRQLKAGDVVPDGYTVGDHLLAEASDGGGKKAKSTKSGDGDAPKGNASREEWAAHADSLGVTYEPDASRDDIKAAVAKAAEAQD